MQTHLLVVSFWHPILAWYPAKIMWSVHCHLGISSAISHSKMDRKLFKAGIFWVVFVCLLLNEDKDNLLLCDICNNCWWTMNNNNKKKISCTSVGTVDKKADKKVDCRLIELLPEISSHRPSTVAGFVSPRLYHICIFWNITLKNSNRKVKILRKKYLIWKNFFF